MRYLWAIVSAFVISTSTPSLALAGGMSGGTGIGGLIDEIAQDIQAILKNPCEIDRDMIRRILMRLWVYGQAEVTIGGRVIRITWKIGHVESLHDSIEVREVTDY